MPIAGHGIDIVEVARIQRMVEEHGQRFLAGCFTPAELEYCRGQPRRQAEHLAGRFAVKEAILKVLGSGWSGGIAWTDMEILPAPGGRPVLTLSGYTRELADRLGIVRWHVSISHIETHAVGSAIGETMEVAMPQGYNRSP
jgi:holo-[acyl-carrier protein] synthase